MFEEQRLRIVVVGETPEAYLFVRATTFDRERIEQWLELAGVLARLSIQRQYDVGLHATRGLMVSQVRDRLAKPAGAGEGPQLCGEVENPGLQILPRRYGGGSPGSASPTAAGT